VISDYYGAGDGFAEIKLSGRMPRYLEPNFANDGYRR
jgi:hypothetical protein